MTEKLVLALVIALALGFFGLKLNKIIIVVLAIILGYNLGNYLGEICFRSELVSIILSLSFGIIFAALSMGLYKIGVFFLCFTLTTAIIYTNVDIELIKTTLGPIIGIIVGFLAIKYTESLIIIITSISGSLLFTQTISQMFNLPNELIKLAIFIIMIIITLRYQFDGEPQKNKFTY